MGTKLLIIYNFSKCFAKKVFINRKLLQILLLKSFPKWERLYLLSVSKLFAGPWRQTVVGIVTTSTRFENDSVDKIKASLVIYEYIAVYSIEDVVLIVGIVSAIILCMKSETDELVMNLLLCGQTGFGNKRLY